MLPAVNNPLQALLVADRDATGQDALHGAPVEHCEGRRREVFSFQSSSSDVKMLLCFFGEGGGVGGPAQVLCCLYHRAIAAEWCVGGVSLSKVDNHFFSFVLIQGQTVLTAPASHFLTLTLILT